MRRLEIKNADIMRIAVQQEILRSEESRYDHRLHGVLLVCSGLSTYEVAELFGHSPRTVQYWVQKFEKSGFSGLQDTPRPGRPSALEGAKLESIGKDLRRPPGEFGYSQNLWDGRLLSHHVAQKFGVVLGIRQCQRLFTRLGFRRRKPRSIIAHSDPGEQKRFKKTSTASRKKRR